jgi:hypothetical protein
MGILETGVMLWGYRKMGKEAQIPVKLLHGRVCRNDITEATAPI